MNAPQHGIRFDTLKEAARVLKCIGHPIRLQIIELLDNHEELNVTAIYEALGLEQAVASQHLLLMRDKGILAARRDGVNVFYRLEDPRVPRVLQCIRECEL